jgi:putative ATPase
MPSATSSGNSMNVPLAEKMRPNTLDDYYGQTRIVGENTFIHKIFESDGEFPSMLLWGPAGSGKVSARPHSLFHETKTSFCSRQLWLT